MAQVEQRSDWYGWIYFAGVLITVRGFFQIFLGILALVSHDVYVVTPNHLAVFNFTAWGWIHIVLGVILLTAAGSVFSGRWWGRVVGSIMVGLAFFANLAFLPAYPVWALVASGLDLVILYALLVKGGEVRV